MALEITGAAVAILTCAFTPYGSSMQRAVALLTATYFLVRGLDNAEKGELLQKLRSYVSRIAIKRLLGFTAILSAILIVSLIPKDADVRPPYMANKDGSRLPVSSLECGNLFIICDEIAWREHARLLKGTPDDRARAEQEAERRLRQYLAKRGGS